MSNLPILPAVDEAAVREALDRLRQARSLGETPLRRLVWIHGQIAAVSGGSAVQVEVALFDALAGLISERLAELRRVEQLPSVDPVNQDEVWAAMRVDFAQENVELEAWSLLYHRYVCIDFDWHVQQAKTELDMSERNLRRRLRHGFRRLTEVISRKEVEARSRSRRLWLELKLPPATSGLTDVEDMIAQIADLLAEEGTVPGAMVIGPGGIGKSALSREATYRLIQIDRFANIIWLSLNGMTTYQSLLALIAIDFGFYQVGEHDLTSLEAALRLSLERTPTLLVLDAADHLQDFVDVIAHLAQLIGPGQLLITGRLQPPAETPLRLIQVKPLDRTAFSRLIERTARDRRVPAAVMTPETLDVLYTTLGGNPLAGRLVASQLGMLPLNRIIANLSTLETAEGTGLFDALFGAVWDTLDDDARRVAIALTLLPPAGAYWHDILIMFDLPAERLDRGLQQLVACSLLEVDPNASYYVMHGLTRLFVEEQAQIPPFDAVYREVLHAAVERERAETQQHDELARSPNVSTATVTQALSLLHRELQTGFEPRTLSGLVQQLAPAVRCSGLWPMWCDALVRIEKKLRSEGAHPTDLCRVLLEVGVAKRWLGQFDSATTYLEETVIFSGESGDFTTQAEALLELAHLQAALGQPADAFEATQRAAAVAHRYGAVWLRRRALIRLIDMALANNQPEAARQLADDALRTYHDEVMDGIMLSTLGMVRLRKGDIVQAAQYQEQALEAFQADGDLTGLGRTYLRLGITYQKKGDLDGALHALGEGLRIMEQIGDALGRARTLSNLGAVQLQLEQYTTALDLWQEAIRLQDQLGDQVGMAYTWYNLAVLQWEIGHQADAWRAFAEAQRLSERLGLATLLSQTNHHPLNDL